MKVMLGIWIAPEEMPREAGGAPQALPEARHANRQEIESAVRLARAYRDVILAVSVGNETQVFWSDHRVPLPRLIGFVRELRSRIRQPVTVADDFNFWNKPESQGLAREVDFIVTHIHPLWNGILLEEALDWTWSTLEAIASHHPGHLVVLGETGWATRKHNEGEQARLIRGQPGEEPQARFYSALRDRADRERLPVFFFEAFDENWKGGPHPNEVEKHWGLFRADRTPKKAMAHEH
jgi:exo-beta-1,3-glucanase (GH17 family)